MEKHLTSDLSVRGIKSLQKAVEQYKQELAAKCRTFCERLAEKGVEVAKAQVTSLDAVFTGELLSSIHSEDRGSENGNVAFAVVADSSHAAFVCFGTGQYGLDYPYPYPLPDGVSWSYATGKTIRQNAKTGRYYWFYPGKDGKWHYTEGMPARPFMHNTSIELQKIVAETAKEVFGK